MFGILYFETLCPSILQVLEELHHDEKHSKIMNETSKNVMNMLVLIKEEQSEEERRHEEKKLQEIKMKKEKKLKEMKEKQTQAIRNFKIS